MQITCENPNVNINGEFLTAGRAVFTVEPAAGYVEANGCKPHYTYKVTTKESNTGNGNVSFVSLLTGPDNTEDYAYIGLLTANGFRTTAKSSLPADSVPVRIVGRVIAALLAGNGDKIETAGWKVRHEGKCGRCGRALTVPESVSHGIGPECRRKMIGG